MSNPQKPKSTDDEEEFESLFESLGAAGPKPVAEPTSRREPGQRLSDSKRRRDTLGASAAVSEEEVQLPAPAPDALKTPLDLDAARQEFLLPEPEAGPPSPPPAAPKKRRADKKAAPRRKDGKIKPVQMLLLVVLLVLVLAVYGALAVIITRTRPSATATPLPLLELPTATAGLPTSTPRPEPTATATAAAPTVTPQPAVSTQFDLRLLQDPDNVTLRLQRGYKYIELRAYGLAVADFEHALQLDAENAALYVGLGQAHFYARQWTSAQENFKAALALDNNNEEAHFWLGTVLYYEGQYAEAAAEFDAAAELAPENPRNEAWLALAAAQAGQLEEAGAAAERAITLDPKYAPAYLGRAQVSIARQQFETAQGDLLYARTLAPYEFETLHTLGRFYVEHMPERIVEAEQLALQAQNWATWDLQRAQALHTLGRIYLSLGRTDEAWQAFTQALELALVEGKIALPGLEEDLVTLRRQNP